MNKEERQLIKESIRSLRGALQADTVSLDLEFSNDEAAKLFWLCNELDMTPGEMIEYAVERHLNDDTPEGQVSEGPSTEGR